MMIDVRWFWLIHSAARHISEHAELPGDLWLLAHELQLILVEGTGPKGRSVGMVIFARPDGPDPDPDPDNLAFLIQSALDELQDLVVTTNRSDWPQESGRLMAAASIEDNILRCGYVTQGDDIQTPGSPSVVFPPVALDTTPPAPARIAG